jgi:hypothetical protein
VAEEVATVIARVAEVSPSISLLDLSQLTKIQGTKVEVAEVTRVEEVEATRVEVAVEAMISSSRAAAEAAGNQPRLRDDPVPLA